LQLAAAHRAVEADAGAVNQSAAGQSAGQVAARDEEVAASQDVQEWCLLEPQEQPDAERPERQRQEAQVRGRQA